MKNRLSVLSAGAGAVVLGALPAYAVGEFTVSAPTFDWSVLGTIAGAIILVQASILIYRKVMSMLGR